MRTKIILAIATTMLITTTSTFSQNLNKEVKKLWWDICQTCFNGAGITKKNGLFMSTASKDSAGFIYTLEKNLAKRIIKRQYRFSYMTLKTDLPDMSKIKGKPIVQTPCPFTLNFTKSQDLEVFGQIIDASNVNKVSVELQNYLKKAKSLEIDITTWGLDKVEVGQFEIFLQNNISSGTRTAIAAKITDGNHYLATVGVIVMGIKMNYKFDKVVLDKVKLIYETNKAELMKAGLSINSSSDTELTTFLNYSSPFIPFLIFNQITREATVRVENTNDRNRPKAYKVKLKAEDFSLYNE